MQRTVFAAALSLALAAPLAVPVPARADRADEDLAAVRKAVSGTRVAQVEAVPEAPPSVRPSRPAKAAEGRWLRVRITERAGKHGKVSLNLPLGLARAFGEDWPIHGCEDCGQGRKVTLGDVLRSLESGQNLVEIEDDEATVRVWVD